MIRKLTTVFTLLGLFFSGHSSAEPLYWSATKDNKELMILGSIHMGKLEMYPLPEPVLAFLQTSDTVVLELNPNDTPTNLSMGEQETAGQYLTHKQQAELQNIYQELELSFPFELLLKQPTWQAALLLQLSYFSKLGYQQELGIDSYIAEQAISANIPVKGLETADFQISLFKDDPEVGRELLTDTIENWDKNKQVSLCMQEDWLTGDKASLKALAEESEGSDKLADSVIYNRNQKWAEMLDSAAFLPSGSKTLVVVGTLHLVGKENLINLLKEKGFTVKQLSNSTESSCKL